MLMPAIGEMLTQLIQGGKETKKELLQLQEFHLITQITH